MKWVKIEDGCEMPWPWEYIVVIAHSYGSTDWHESIFAEGGEFLSTFDRGCMTDHVTHWARVELPEDMK